MPKLEAFSEDSLLEKADELISLENWDNNVISEAQDLEEVLRITGNNKIKVGSPFLHFFNKARAIRLRLTPPNSYQAVPKILSTTHFNPAVGGDFGEGLAIVSVISAKIDTIVNNKLIARTFGMRLDLELYNETIRSLMLKDRLKVDQILACDEFVVGKKKNASEKRCQGMKDFLKDYPSLPRVDAAHLFIKDEISKFRIENPTPYTFGRTKGWRTGIEIDFAMPAAEIEKFIRDSHYELMVVITRENLSYPSPGQIIAQRRQKKK